MPRRNSSRPSSRVRYELSRCSGKASSLLLHAGAPPSHQPSSVPLQQGIVLGADHTATPRLVPVAASSPPWPSTSSPSVTSTSACTTIAPTAGCAPTSPASHSDGALALPSASALAEVVTEQCSPAEERRRANPAPAPLSVS